MVSLGTLFLAAQLADILWPVFLLSGLEVVAIEPGNTRLTPLNFVSYPYSHSLVALTGWALLFAALYRLLRGSRMVAIVTVAVLVLSHWVLDVLTHRPDMPITLSGPERVGLGLWNRPLVSIPLELLLFGFGVAVYVKTTRARSRAGTIALWGLIVFLVAVYVAALFGPPPPNVTTLAWSANSMWLLIIWGYWIDRLREPAE
jgi:hypothetical protein